MPLARPSWTSRAARAALPAALAVAASSTLAAEPAADFGIVTMVTPEQSAAPPSAASGPARPTVYDVQYDYGGRHYSVKMTTPPAVGDRLPVDVTVTARAAVAPAPAGSAPAEPAAAPRVRYVYAYPAYPAYVVPYGYGYGYSYGYPYAYPGPAVSLGVGIAPRIWIGGGWGWGWHRWR